MVELLKGTGVKTPMVSLYPPWTLRLNGLAWEKLGQPKKITLSYVPHLGRLIIHNGNGKDKNFYTLFTKGGRARYAQIQGALRQIGIKLPLKKTRRYYPTYDQRQKMLSIAIREVKK